MSNNLKKVLIYLFIAIFSILILLKYSVSIIKNEILSTIKSNQFDVFIVNIFDQKLEKLSEIELSEEKKIFYIKNFEKIIKKFESQ
tara:strand:- start:1951 stop:2208 length:258 start_codon:yes stop_codon:yes gene_type:complete